MATISENLQILATAKENIKSAIEGKGQDLTDVPFTEYAGKISAIESGGSSVECDLIDVAELPTSDVKDNKVYRVLGDSKTSYYYAIDDNVSDELIFPNGIVVDSIDDVTDPIETIPSGSDVTVAVLYTDRSTGIGYMWADLYGTGTPERLSLGDFFTLLMGVPIPDKGLVKDVSEITESGVYCVLQETDTAIGVPNAKENKSVLQYNGTEWQKIGLSDLVDVAQLSGNVQDDKIYRIAGQSGTYYVSFVGTAGGDTAQVTTLSDFLTMLGVSVSIKDEISVNGIDSVTEPMLSGENGLFIYTDTSTYIGYVFGDFEGTGVVDKMTISDFVNMMNTLTGGNYPTLTDNGSKEDVSGIIEDGVFYISEKTIIGVPNATNNKNIMQYDGTEWKEVGAGGVTKQFEFRFPDGATLTSQVFSYIYDEQYTIYSNDNHNDGKTWLFDKTTGETTEIFPYGGVAYFAKYGDFVCGGGHSRYYHSFIYNVKTKTLVKTYNYGYSNIQIIYSDVLFSETGNGYQYYNFSTGKSLDESFNLPVSSKMFRVSEKKFISIYYSKIYVCDISNMKKEMIALPSDIPASSNTKSHSIEMLDENTALVAGGTFVGILDVNTNEFIQYMSGSTMSPTCSQLQDIKRVGSYYLCVNYEYSNGRIIKIDFDANEYSILMEGIQYPKVILTHTDWENAVILANGKMFFFDNSDESITQISTNSSLTLDYFEQINEINLLFITGSYLYNLSITDGSFTYKTVGNARTVIKGTDKYLIVPTGSNSSNYMYITSSDLSDFTQINTGVQGLTTIKQKGTNYHLIARNFDSVNRDTITEYVFDTKTDTFKMVSAKNIDEMFQ